MIAAVEALMKLMLSGNQDAAAALALPGCASEVAKFARNVRESSCDGFEIIATARVHAHHYVKARVTGAQPLTVQFRLGEYEGRWMVWELIDLTGRRGAWTR
jgi:hypothetical protein